MPGKGKRASVWVVEFRCAKDEPWLRSNVTPGAYLTEYYACFMMRHASPSEERFRRVWPYDRRASRTKGG